MQGRLLTVREVATYLHVSTKTVQRLISRGELKASKVAADWRIDPEDVKVYLESRRADSR